jgi:hypothetical protein
VSAPSLPSFPAFQTKFTKPIALRDGARLATIDHAQMFLTKLSPAQITANQLRAHNPWQGTTDG